jgi:hypothetical protein
MQNIESIMVNKSFEEIQDLEKDGVRVRTLNATEEFKKLYLLVSSKFDTKESHVLNGQIYERVLTSWLRMHRMRCLRMSLLNL